MRCCCGCAGTGCSFCTGTGDAAEYVTASGITIAPSGTCYDTSASLNAVGSLAYSGLTSGFAACVLQLGTGIAPGCVYQNNTNVSDIFSPAATYQFQGGALCPGTNPFYPITCLAYLILSSTAYRLTIIGYNASLGSFPIFFDGSISVSSPPCKISTLTFTNSLTLGAAVLAPYYNNSSGIFMWAFGTGGTAVVKFNKSCCP